MYGRFACNQRWDPARRGQSVARGRTSADRKTSSRLPCRGYSRHDVVCDMQHTSRPRPRCCFLSPCSLLMRPAPLSSLVRRRQLLARFPRNNPGSPLRRFHSAHDLRAGKVFQAPGGDIAEQFDQAPTGAAEPIRVPPPIGELSRFLEQALRAHHAQPRRQDVGGYPFRRAQEVLEIALAAHKVAHDQHRPAIANEVQRTGDGTVGPAPRARFLVAFHQLNFTCLPQGAPYNACITQVTGRASERPPGTPLPVRVRRLSLADSLTHTFAPCRGVTVRPVVFGVLALWFVAVFLLGTAGALVRSPGTPPIPILIGATVPPAVFLAAYWVWPAFRAYVLSSDLSLAAAIQAWRAGGLVFLALYKHGLLPGAFAWPAGLGDIAIGVTAPWVALALVRRPGFATSRFFIGWNLFGSLDLVVAVGTGGLHSALASVGEVTTAPMAELPLALIPAYL